MVFSGSYLNLELSGWPMACLWIRSTAGDPRYVALPYEDGIQLLPSRLPPWQYSTDGRVPVRPLWAGLAVNSLVMAGLGYGLLSLPGAVRRRIRTRRGQCPSCGYPAADSAVCSECGRPVSPGPPASTAP